VHAGADERIQSAGVQIERRRSPRAGYVDVDVYRGEALAGLAGRFVVLQIGDDPALLDTEITHADTGLPRELPPKHRSEPNAT